MVVQPDNNQAANRGADNWYKNAPEDHFVEKLAPLLFIAGNFAQEPAEKDYEKERNEDAI